ncbi:MAG: SsrA-binding protein SmpB [Patescibacteria group bacterium]|nr:SsrA-binding protein SmpB [Patescibacteria group bacterium]
MAQPILENKKAHFDYQILETFEAGISLTGQEVKSIMTGKANMAGAFVLVRPRSAELINFQIQPYQPLNKGANFKEDRPRKLLLHKDQINYLMGKAKEGGLAIIPLTIYKKKSKIKLAIGLARHKNKRDKRETIKKRETQREIKRVTG